jgi:hypothetical protein
MNEIGCQRAIRQLIQNNEAVLVHGHYHQGTYREIGEIVLAAVSPPTEYYHYKIQITDAEETSFGRRPGNTAKPKRRAVYNCIIHMVDLALASGNLGEEQYLAQHIDFRSMVDGVTAMVSGSYWRSGGTYAAYFVGLPICIEDPESDSSFDLVRGAADDRSIRVQNLDFEWRDTNNDVWTPMFYSRCSFALEEQIS